MRDRLIEVLDNAFVDFIDFANLNPAEKTSTEFIADYLLDDGWFRPPCKVGDVVYFVPRNSGKPIGTVDEAEIVMIGKTESGFCAKGKIGENTFDIYPHFEIDNYTFYTSREDAEKALRKDEGK